MSERMLSYADEISVLDKGRLVNKGSYADILTITLEIAAKSLVDYNGPSTSSTEEAMDSERPQKLTTESDNMVQALDETTGFSRRDGHWSVYMYYFRSARYVLVILFLVLSDCQNFTSNFLVPYLNSSYLGSNLGTNIML
jgi:ATP-binding cassette subfamily C (CFTR/MRP) protein 1